MGPLNITLLVPLIQYLINRLINAYFISRTPIKENHDEESENNDDDDDDDDENETRRKRAIAENEDDTVTTESVIVERAAHFGDRQPFAG